MPSIIRTPKVEPADVDVKGLEPLLVHAGDPAEMPAGPTAGDQFTRPDAEPQQLRPPTVPFYTALPSPSHQSRWRLVNSYVAHTPIYAQPCIEGYAKLSLKK
jgi:hypothetical protein